MRPKRSPFCCTVSVSADFNLAAAWTMPSRHDFGRADAVHALTTSSQTRISPPSIETTRSPRA